MIDKIDGVQGYFLISEVFIKELKLDSGNILKRLLIVFSKKRREPTQSEKKEIKYRIK